MIDLGAVRAALGRLDTLAARGDLTTPEARGRLDRWLAQQEGVMSRKPVDGVARTENLYVRVDPDTVRRIESLKARMMAARPGLTITRADVMRVLIREGLDRYEQEED